MSSMIDTESDDWMELRALLSNECSNTNSNFSKADITRSMMAISDLDMSACGGSELDELQSAIIAEDMRRYASLVDDMNGINNYADACLTLCKTAKNESSTWTSSISADDLCSFLPDERTPCFSDLDEMNRALAQSPPAPAPTANSGQAAMRPCGSAPTSRAGQHPTSVTSVQSLPAPPTPAATPGQAPVASADTQRLPPPLPAATPRQAPVASADTQRLPPLLPAATPRQVPMVAAATPRQTHHEPSAPSRPGPLFPAAGSGTAGYRVAGQVRSLTGQSQVGSYPDQTSDTAGRGRPVPGGGWGAGGSDRGCNGGREAGRGGSGFWDRRPRGRAGRGRGYGKRGRNGWDDEEDDEEDPAPPPTSAFKTAKDQLITNHLKSKGYTSEQAQKVVSSASYGSRKSLGARRGFVPPVKECDSDGPGGRSGGPMTSSSADSVDSVLDERLKNIEPRMVELITNEIMDRGPAVSWDDIAGLEFAKTTIKEMVIWPLLRPDIFTGLRGLPKGLLLFGPPGTGKTLIGKCIASQSQSTFFSISASSLTSKWIGEGEKMVRALFAVARCHQPAVVFIDEVDSLLSQRSESEHESSRRIKTEFLIQLDGAGTSSEDRLLVVGATNRPQELDEAARRRLVKRLYVPLPDGAARRQIVARLLGTQQHQLSEAELDDVAARTGGYSGADVANLCREAALGPIRCIGADRIHDITPEQVRPLIHDDFVAALDNIRASVSSEDLHLYTEWNRRFGTGGAAPRRTAP